MIKKQKIPNKLVSDFRIECFVCFGFRASDFEFSLGGVPSASLRTGLGAINFVAVVPSNIKE
jgi:hypothetical protein